MDATSYGAANLLPSIGLILGSFASAQLLKKYNLNSVINIGIIFATIVSAKYWIFK